MTDLPGILGYVSVLLVFAWVVCAVIEAARNVKSRREKR